MATTASPRQPRPAPSARSTASRRRSVPTYFNVVYALSGDYYESTVLLYHQKVPEYRSSTIPVLSCTFTRYRCQVQVLQVVRVVVVRLVSCRRSTKYAYTQPRNMNKTPYISDISVA